MYREMRVIKWWVNNWWNSASRPTLECNKMRKQKLPAFHKTQFSAYVKLSSDQIIEYMLLKWAKASDDKMFSLSLCQIFCLFGFNFKPTNGSCSSHLPLWLAQPIISLHIHAVCSWSAGFCYLLGKASVNTPVNVKWYCPHWMMDKSILEVAGQELTQYCTLVYCLNIMYEYFSFVWCNALD